MKNMKLAKQSAKVLCVILSASVAFQAVGCGVATAVGGVLNRTKLTAQAEEVTAGNDDASDDEDEASENGNADVERTVANTLLEQEMANAVRSHSGSEGKEETVYVISDANGNQQKVIVSEWLRNAEGSSTITDRTSLSDIENVNGYQDYTVNRDGTITWQADGSDIYYQGTSDEEIPVEVGITYYLDGKEIAPQELAGKSGHVKIRFDYTNHAVQTVEIGGEETEIAVPFAMMSGVVLPASRFENITVSNGRIISEGQNSIVLGLAFPGLSDSINVADLKEKIDDEERRAKFEEKEIPEYVEIEADATDFELGMTMTASLSNLLSDLSLTDGLDTSELHEKMDELSDGSEELVDGTKSLKDGTAELTSGVAKLSDGSKELLDGGTELRDGAADLKEGTETLVSGTAELRDGAGTLANGTSTLANGANALAGGVDQISSGASALAEGANKANSGAKALSSGIGQLRTQLFTNLGATQASLQTLKDTIDGIIAKIKAVQATLAAGETELRGGLTKMTALADALLAAVTELQKEETADVLSKQQVGTFVAVSQEMADSTAKMQQQANAAVVAATNAYNEAVAARVQAQNAYDEAVAARDANGETLQNALSVRPAAGSIRNAGAITSGTTGAVSSEGLSGESESILDEANSQNQESNGIEFDSNEAGANGSDGGTVVQEEGNNDYGLNQQNEDVVIENQTVAEPVELPQESYASETSDPESAQAEESAPEEAGQEASATNRSGRFHAAIDALSETFRVPDGMDSSVLCGSLLVVLREPDAVGEVSDSVAAAKAALDEAEAAVEKAGEALSQANMVKAQADAAVTKASAASTAANNLNSYFSYNTEAEAVSSHDGKVAYIITLATTLDAGLKSINAGADTYFNGVNALLDGLTAGLQQISDTLAASLNSSDSMAQLNAGFNQLQAGASALASDSDGLGALAKGAGDLAAGASQLQSKTPELVSGIYAINEGAYTLYHGTIDLDEGAHDLDQGVFDLNDGVGRLYDGIVTLGDGIFTLQDGARTLDDGAAELMDGMIRFDEEGIQQLTELFGDDVDEVIDRLNAVMDAGRSYTTYGGALDDMESSVKFIYRTEAIKAE